MPDTPIKNRIQKPTNTNRPPNPQIGDREEVKAVKPKVEMIHPKEQTVKQQSKQEAKRNATSNQNQEEGYPIYHIDDALIMDSTEEEGSQNYLPCKRPFYLSLYAGGK